VYLTSEDLWEFYSELARWVRTPGEQVGAVGSNRRLTRLWRDLEPALARGERLSEALAGVSPQIGAGALALIRAGEESDALAETLDLLARNAQRRVGLERCFHLALIYPVLVVAILILVLIALGSSVMPLYRDWHVRMVDIMAQLGAELPYPYLWALRHPPSGAAVGLSLALATPLGVAAALGLGLGTIWLGIHTLRRRPALRQRILRAVPGLNGLAVLGAASRWCDTLGHLLGRRVDLPTALTLAEPTLDHRLLEARAAEVRRRVEKGERISIALLAQRVLPLTAVGLLLAAEEQGHLARTLRRLGEHFAERLEVRLRVFESWLEPALILVAGVLVGGVCLFLYLRITTEMFGAYLSMFTIPRLIR
jgi:type II secretory pathway component PulF